MSVETDRTQFSENGHIVAVDMDDEMRLPCTDRAADLADLTEDARLATEAGLPVRCWVKSEGVFYQWDGEKWQSLRVVSDVEAAAIAWARSLRTSPK